MTFKGVVEFLPSFLKDKNDEVSDSLRESLEWTRNNIDPKENEETRPPEDERVKLLCFWVVEYFPPSQHQALLQGMRSLDWDKAKLGPKRESPLEWVEEARASPYGSAWRNVGRLTRETDSSKPMARAAPLPDGVEFVAAHLQQVLPSHTAVCIQFVLEESLTEKLDELLRTEYRAEASEGGAILGAANQKQIAIKRARKRIRERMSKWFKNHLPGRFAGGALDGAFPSCEFLLTAETRPFWDSNRYLHVLGVEHPFRSWKSGQLSGLRFSRLGPGRRMDYHSVLAGRQSDLFPDEDMENWGGRNKAGFVNRVGNFSQWFAVRSLGALLTSYERPVAHLRDRISSEGEDTFQATGYLKEAVANWSRLQRDTINCLSELRQKSKSKVRFIGAANKVAFQKIDYSSTDADDDSLDIQPRSDDEEGSDYQVLEGLRHDLQERSERLEKLITQVGEVLVAESNLNAAWASARLQETAIVVTVLIASVGIVSLLESHLSGPFELTGVLLVVMLLVYGFIKGLVRAKKWVGLG